MCVAFVAALSRGLKDALPEVLIRWPLEIHFRGLRGTCSSRLFPKNYRRPADSFPFEVDGYLNAVRDLDERNAAIHAVLLTVKGHRAYDRAGAGPPAGNCKS